MKEELEKLIDLSPYTILVVDDVTFSRVMVGKLLRGLGNPEVRLADDGNEALKILQSNVHFDFVLSDFKMPGFNGLQLLKAIRTGQTDINRGTPFAMLTGFSERHLVDMALALDVNAFLAKPVSRKTLAGRLNKMLIVDSGEMPVKPVEDYEEIVIEEAKIEPIPTTQPSPKPKSRLKNVKITQKVVGNLSSLKGKFQESDLAQNITRGVDRLITDAGSEVATQVISFVDDLVVRGILELEDIPDILDVRDIGPQTPTAPVKRKKVSGVWASADSGQGEENFYALAEIPLGATLSEDIFAKEGSLFIRKGIPLTQQIISILAHLCDIGFVSLSSMVIEETEGTTGAAVKPRGVYANFSPSPGNDGALKAFDSESPPSKRFTNAMSGNGGWEKCLSAGDIQDGAKLSRDLYTADGRLYMYAGTELTGKVISILRDIQDLGNLKTNIWITT